MTSYNQADHPYLHLRMALYVTSRLFHSTEVMLQKLVHRNREIRRQEHGTCTELRCTDALYNLANGTLNAIKRARW